MVTQTFQFIELIAPHGWSVEDRTFTVELEAVCDGTDSLILDIPLHEDFFDMCTAYCEQYKKHIKKKIGE